MEKEEKKAQLNLPLPMMNTKKARKERHIGVVRTDLERAAEFLLSAAAEFGGGKRAPAENGCGGKRVAVRREFEARMARMGRRWVRR
jgi:hypothetical protein